MAHWMRNLPTMTVLAERSKHRNVQLCTLLLCDSGQERPVTVGMPNAIP